MPAILLLLFLTGAQPAEPPASAPDDQPKAAFSFKTAKSMAVLEKCLAQELADLGDQTLMQEKEASTLMIRNGEGAPLLIEIKPKLVTITTRADLETRTRVQHCV
jgi:hypothetical protein